MDREDAVELLVGDEMGTVGEFLTFGAALVALVGLLEGAVWLGRVFGATSMADSGRLLLLAIGGLAVLAAGTHGFLNGGFLVGVVVAFSPRVGVEAFRALAPAFDVSVPAVPVADAPETTLLVGVAGTLLTVTGLGVRRLVRERRTGESDGPTGEGRR